jgi:L-2-hydroxycarboxylate dehydrogenase (NAD+)
MEQLFSYEVLLSFTRSVFEKIGCPEKDAATAASVLLSADLRGIDSHGIARLIGYVRLHEA